MKRVACPPDDNAVVEFWIGDNGAVSNAQTVYTRGTYAAARAMPLPWRCGR